MDLTCGKDQQTLNKIKEINKAGISINKMEKNNITLQSVEFQNESHKPVYEGIIKKHNLRMTIDRINDFRETI